MPLQENLWNHLRQVARERDPYLATAGHFFVREYVREQLSRWGVVESHPFTVRGQGYENLLLHLPGQRASRSPILLGAHFDAVPGSPGADDNATGVAVLLELARTFSERPASYPIVCAAFDLEEMGLWGSRALADEWRRQGRPLRLMLSLEMLGYRDRAPGSQRYPAGLDRFYPNQGDFIALIGNWSTLLDLMHFRHHLKQSGQVPCEYLPAGQRGMLVPDVRRSDHAPFWDEGYRAILVTDTANLRNPHYHRASDRLETLDLAFLTGICQGLEAGIRGMGDILRLQVNEFSQSG